MRAISKSVKLIVSIALVIQLISFSGFAVTSRLHQKQQTELVENTLIESTRNDDSLNIFNLDERKFEISSNFSIKSSHLLAVFSKACFIKHQKQNFRFINTVKNSLLAKLLPYLYYNSPKDTFII